MCSCSRSLIALQPYLLKEKANLSGESKTNVTVPAPGFSGHPFRGTGSDQGLDHRLDLQAIADSARSASIGLERAGQNRRAGIKTSRSAHSGPSVQGANRGKIPAASRSRARRPPWPNALHPRRSGHLQISVGPKTAVRYSRLRPRSSPFAQWPAARAGEGLTHGRLGRHRRDHRAVRRVTNRKR